MVLLLRGQSACKICGQVINEEDNICGFTHFVNNTKDPLYFFSDEAFHEHCFENTANADLAVEYATMGINANNPENRICIVTGELITRMEDHFFIGYLTSDKNSLLHQFNFTHIKVSAVLQWDKRELLIRELIEYRDSGNWANPEWGRNRNTYLDHLIELLHTPRSSF